MNGIVYKSSPPFHPESNGAAENAVKTVKNCLHKSAKNANNLNLIINNFLLSYRVTPHCSTGLSPAELMFNRKIRCVLDLGKPSKNMDKNFNKQVTETVKHHKIIGNVITMVAE